MQMLMPVTEETQRLVDWVDKGANLEACVHGCMCRHECLI